MYRAAALKAIRLCVDLDDHARLGEVARAASIELTGHGRGPILLDGEDVTEAIRAENVSAAASVMSTVSEVRAALVAQQRAIGHSESCVMEGRDIGTVVFPDADLKVFLVATLEERARRRYEQMISMDSIDEAGDREAALREIRESIAERDRRDSTREDSPLRQADDAVEIDTTSMTIEQQVERVLDLAVERGAPPPAARGTVNR
jgi:cytidylate kinase